MSTTIYSREHPEGEVNPVTQHGVSVYEVVGDRVLRTGHWQEEQHPEEPTPPVEDTGEPEAKIEDPAVIYKYDKEAGKVVAKPRKKK